MLRSAEVVTVVVAVAVLLAATGSLVVELTVAVLVMTVPFSILALTVATMINVTLASAARTPILQVGALHVVPTDGVALTKVSPAGRLSVTDTDCASLGPRLVTVNV